MLIGQDFTKDRLFCVDIWIGKCLHYATYIETLKYKKRCPSAKDPGKKLWL